MGELAASAATAFLASPLVTAFRRSGHAFQTTAACATNSTRQKL
jgi:hypothetical protein